MCIYAFVSPSFCVRNARIGTLCKYALIHIGVGLCVARFEKMGNARASVRGTSNGSTPTLFYAAKPISLTLTAFSGAKGIKTYCNMLKVDFLIPIPGRKFVNFDDVVRLFDIYIEKNSNPERYVLLPCEQPKTEKFPVICINQWKVEAIWYDSDSKEYHDLIANKTNQEKLSKVSVEEVSECIKTKLMDCLKIEQ